MALNLGLVNEMHYCSVQEHILTTCMCFLQVHRGFYAAYHNTTLREQVVNAVQAIQQARGDLGIIVTGHSMGGAMASFCALDLTVSFDISVMVIEI
jgi:putative lipase involved disintegration of autophagic bodies